MRLIDADALVKRMKNTWDMQDLYLPVHFIDLVEDEPTVEQREETLLLYRYGTLLRPAGPGAVPREGLHAVEEGIVMPHGRPYWSIVDYERSLSDEEVKQYELEFIGCVEVKR